MTTSAANNAIDMNGCHRSKTNLYFVYTFSASTTSSKFEYPSTGQTLEVIKQ